MGVIDLDALMGPGEATLAAIATQDAIPEDTTAQPAVTPESRAPQEAATPGAETDQEETQTAVQPQAPVSEEVAEQAAAPAKLPLPAPQFDLVRVETDGTVLVVGKAVSHSAVRVLVDGQPQLDTQAGRDGGFVAFLDLGVFADPRILSLEVSKDGQTSASVEDIILAPPPPPVVADETADETADEAEVETADARDDAAPVERMHEALPAQTEQAGLAQGAFNESAAQPPLPSGDASGPASAATAVAVDEAKPLDPEDAEVTAARTSPEPDDVEASADGQRPPQTRETAPPQTAAESVPTQTVAETVPTQTVAETAPTQSVAEAVPTQSVAETAPTQSVAEIAPTQSVAETAPTQSVVETVPSQAVTEDVAAAEPTPPQSPPQNPVGPDVTASLGVQLETSVAPQARRATPVPSGTVDARTGRDAPLAPALVARSEAGAQSLRPAPTPKVAAAGGLALAAPNGGLAPGVPDQPADAPPRAAQTAAPVTPDVPASSAPAVFVSGPQGVETLPSAALEPGTVALDSISYDTAGEVLLAGRGTGSDYVRVYLDNRPLTTTSVDDRGRWRVVLPEVDTGTYTLRVDQLDAEGAVTARVESPFLRESAEVLASAKATGPVTSITVQPGNTLWAIARDRYGEGLEYVRVFDANRDRIRDPDLIYPGQIFDLPDTSGDEG